MRIVFVVCTLAAGVAIPLAAAGIIYLLPAWPFTAWLLVSFSPVPLGPVPIGVVIPSLLFWLWHPRLFVGAGEVPPRSFYGLVTFSLVSLAWYAIVFSAGIRAHGSTVTITLLAINIACLCALYGLLLIARRRESYFATLALHFFAGVWVLTLAFPALGQPGN
jgi:hypothetical protein